jgi:spore coat polysaccharide biosynthesis protein SpsF
MTRTVVIAQARTGSSRLPRKVMEPIGDRTVLEHVIWRARAVKGADAVCVATTDLPEDDVVAQTAAAAGVAVFRGSCPDVLARYAGAAAMTGADVVMRITCDCPLLDPAVCDAVLALRSRDDLDYAANVIRRDWPHGLDCEAFTAAMLREAAQRATDDYSHEHVTPWIRAHASRQAHLDGPGGEAAAQRWVLDYPEDLQFLRALMAGLPAPPAMPGWGEVMQAAMSNPALSAINAQRRLALQA